MSRLLAAMAWPLAATCRLLHRIGWRLFGAVTGHLLLVVCAGWFAGLLYDIRDALLAGNSVALTSFAVFATVVFALTIGNMLRGLIQYRLLAGPRLAVPQVAQALIGVLWLWDVGDCILYLAQGRPAYPGGGFWLGLIFGFIVDDSEPDGEPLPKKIRSWLTNGTPAPATTS